MISIRRFLITISLAVITLVNFVAALQGYRSGLENTDILIDTMLQEKAHLIADLSVVPEGENITQASGNELLFQVFDKNGKLIKRSAQAPISPLEKLEPGFSTISYAGYRWRTFTLKNDDSGVQMLIAERMDLRYYLAEGVIQKTIIPIFLGMPFLSLLIWFIVTQGLKPLNRLSVEVASKKTQDLTPIDQGDLPRELQPLLDSMNGLLSRLSNTFEREKRFSADAAHELRTPLSALKINMFNLKKRLPEDDPDIEIIDQSIARMVHLIEQMLLLYRLSPEQFQSHFTVVDLKAVVQQAIADNYAPIDEKNQEISLEGDEVNVEGDTFALTTLVKNLIDNANKYTPKEGHIRVELNCNSNNAILIVEDSGEGIPDSLMGRALERFYRVNGDQHDSNIQGCGLGLAIVQHIVNLHHGKIELKKSEFLNGLKVEIKLPIHQEFKNEK